ncbi:outer membrane beta-barrel protein [Arcobacter porcinus]|uniref:Porin family protein n=1 Tax=Arcobacter porcinus TaxID=1935204 RepID=A0A5C2HFR5_9BACT|nr:outer membrane beta-barrel protein [Arcobacter porcinus]OCL89584.1 hypothetical protein AAX27_01859 [Aliarcobacter thereius]QEP39962.1 porin family protein [Arcobacter porcinus]
MKKISTVVAGLILTSSSMMAMDIEYFVGAGAERTKSNLELKADDGNDSSNQFDTALKIKAGIILDKIHRAYISYSKPSENWSYSEPGFSEGGKKSITQVLINYDYLLPITEDFRIGGGVHLGLSKVEHKYSNSDNESAKFSDNGLAYGVQIAAIYDITKNVEFELGLGHTRYTAEMKYDDAKEKLKYTTSAYAGLNFKF